MKAVRTVRASMAAAALACLVILAGPVAPTWAHAELISSNPANGATLASVPVSVVLTFTDEIDQQFVRAAVTTPAGTGTVQATTERQIVTIPVVSAGPGPYKVLYRVVSADGHPISGQLQFTVAGTPTATAPPATGPSSGTAAPVLSSVSTAPAAGTDSSSGSSTAWLLWAAVSLAVLAGGGAVLAAVRGRRP